MHTVKRHHSQISLPFAPDRSREAHTSFDTFTHMFGSTTSHHRPSRQPRHRSCFPEAPLATRATQPPKIGERGVRMPGVLGRAWAATRDPPEQQPAPDDAAPRWDPTAAGQVVRTTLTSTPPSSSRHVSPPPPAAAWRTAFCSHSQTRYYWNVETRESRWKKPLELASAEERAARTAEVQKLKDFFAGMEQNILRRIEWGRTAAGGVVPGCGGRDRAGGIEESWTDATAAPDWITGWITPGSSNTTSLTCPSSSSASSLDSIEGLSVLDPRHSFSPGSSLGSLSCEEADDGLGALPSSASRIIERVKGASSRPVIDKLRLIRTISKMEYDLVHQLNPSLRPSPSTRDDKRNDRPLTPTCDILSNLQLTVSLDGEGLDVCLPPAEARARPGSLVRPRLTKRNTCGTLYLGSTLAAPDKDGLIRCVCGVYRHHLLQVAPPSVTTGAAPCGDDAAATHRIFCDRRAPGDYRHLDTVSVPSLDQIADFYRAVFVRSQMEADCIIISLVYVERLIKITGGALLPRTSNWRSLLYSCMVLASKVWDDLSMWNCDFSKIGPAGMAFSLPRTNELELALLRTLAYRVKVDAGEYAKYYFLMRGMLCRSGLARDGVAGPQRPLDARGARTLERAAGSAVSQGSLRGRARSYGGVGTAAEGGGAARGADASLPGAPWRSSPAPQRANLEQLVRM